jgi:hypothetical protein
MDTTDLTYTQFFDVLVGYFRTHKLEYGGVFISDVVGLGKTYI